jgi:monolysocardiolipin acyltransferase
MEPATYSTTGSDSFLAPAAFSTNRMGWVHIFPEASVYQHPEKCLRYFKWGVSRLILEPYPAPDLIPMFIDGTQDVYPEARKQPRWLPRIGANIRVTFGRPVDVDKTFGNVRANWKALAAKFQGQLGEGSNNQDFVDELKFGAEAVSMRVEVAKRVREEVQTLRLSAGYGGEDPVFAAAETWDRKPRVHIGNQDVVTKRGWKE